MLTCIEKFMRAEREIKNLAKLLHTGLSFQIIASAFGSTVGTSNVREDGVVSVRVDTSCLLFR